VAKVKRKDFIFSRILKNRREIKFFKINQVKPNQTVPNELLWNFRNCVAIGFVATWSLQNTTKCYKVIKHKILQKFIWNYHQNSLARVVRARGVEGKNHQRPKQ